jgi:hypothetical protein
MAELRPLFPVGLGGEIPLLCYGLQAWSNVQEERQMFSWLLRVIDHEAALPDPTLSSSLVHRSGWCCRNEGLDSRQAAGGSSREFLIG